MGEVIGSHIQIPKLILKNFQNEKKELFYYDFSICKIKKGHAKTLYREKSYYSKVVEQYLGSEVETPLGEFVKFIKNTSFQNNETPPMGYEDVAFIYIYSLLSRAPSLIKEMNEESPFWNLFDETVQHDIAAHDALILAKNKNLLQGYRVAFLDNNTVEEFVLPTGGIVQYKGYLICPVSAQRAITFDNRRNVNLCEGEISLFEIDSEDEIREINARAFVQEKMRDAKYVVATNREVLNRMLLRCKEEGYVN